MLFIGKEDVSCIDEENETEPRSFLEIKNQHYIGTKHILAALLGYYNVDDITNYQNKAVHFDKEKDLHKHFAFTNHYHCAFKKTSEKGKRHGIVSTKVMWENCAAIVKKEIATLCPDVVIIQSGWSARKEVALKSRIGWLKSYFEDEWNISEDPEIFGLYEAKNRNGKTCYIIGSYHPSFHQWNNDTYLGPLKQRIKKVRSLLKEHI